MLMAVLAKKNKLLSQSNEVRWCHAASSGQQLPNVMEHRQDSSCLMQVPVWLESPTGSGTAEQAAGLLVGPGVAGVP